MVITDGDVLYSRICVQNIHMLTPSNRAGKTMLDRTGPHCTSLLPGKVKNVLKINEGRQSRCSAVLSQSARMRRLEVHS